LNLLQSDHPLPRQNRVNADSFGLKESRRKSFGQSPKSIDRIATPAIARVALDRAVDLCSWTRIFENDRLRVEFLFAVYEKLSAPLNSLVKKSEIEMNRAFRVTFERRVFAKGNPSKCLNG
jgi:hypothetical protein